MGGFFYIPLSPSPPSLPSHPPPRTPASTHTRTSTRVQKKPSTITDFSPKCIDAKRRGWEYYVYGFLSKMLSGEKKRLYIRLQKSLFFEISMDCFFRARAPQSRKTDPLPPLPSPPPRKTTKLFYLRKALVRPPPNPTPLPPPPPGSMLIWSSTSRPRRAAAGRT